MSNRLQLALSLIVVILMVLGTNRLDKYHFEKVQDITRSVYEDRLVAAGYIYEMDQHFDAKKEGLNAFLNDSTTTLNSEAATDLIAQTELNGQIISLIDRFSNTRLTPDEDAYFEKLQRSFDRLTKAEKIIFEGSNPRLQEVLEAYDNITTRRIFTSRMPLFS